MPATPFSLRLATPVALRSASLLFAAGALAACGDKSNDAQPADVGIIDDAEGTVDAAEDTASTLAVPEFGTDETRVIESFASEADGLDRPRDLEFNPDSPNDLWIVSQDNDGMVILFDAGTPDQRSDLRLDAFRNHFMEEVSSLSFGQPFTFGTCQESRNTYDGQGAPNDFMGPTLWPSDLEVFTTVFQDPAGPDLGSHLDMLHQSPNCMGIAHYRDNEYFVFDGMNGHLVHYDFQADHGPGQDDHSDGIVHRYTDVELTRVASVAGNMQYHAETNMLYIADTGASRVIAFEVGSGERTGDLVPLNEPLEDFATYGNSNFSVFAFDGLQEPSGLWIHDGRLFIGDHGNGDIIAYDLATGEELGRMNTGAVELMGITVGPDGKLWFVDAGFNEVLRVTP